jgi:hypothetical protein
LTGASKTEKQSVSALPPPPTMIAEADLIGVPHKTVVRATHRPTVLLGARDFMAPPKCRHDYILRSDYRTI